jgi:5,10-methylenetetrahydromethanopterin reductase
LAESSNRIALGFSGLQYPLPELVEYSLLAERLGYESIWVTETRQFTDAISVLGALAATTKRIKLSSGIIPIYTRTATLIAQSYATLDLLSDGRIMVGIGPGASLFLERQGLSWVKPLAAIREYVTVIRGLLRGKTVTFEGKVVRVKGSKLDLTPVQKTIPIYVAASGARMLTLCGEIADGVVLNCFTPLQYLSRAVELVREGAERVGRDPASVDIAALIYVSVDKDVSKACSMLKPMLARYLAQQPHIARDSGMSDDAIRAVRSAFGYNGIQDAVQLIDDNVVQAINLACTPSECKKKLQAYREVGIDLPVVMTLSNTKEIARLLAPGSS